MSDSFITELYRQTLDRERAVIWGPNAVCRLFSTSPGAGDSEVGSLTCGWVAHSISSIESAGPEEFILEIDSKMIGWAEFRKISKVKISSDASYDPATTQTFKIAQSGKPVQAGHIYQLRLTATGE